jgi:hypothetical protein
MEEEIPIVVELVKEQISLGLRIASAFRRIGFCGKSNTKEKTPTNATLQPR